MRDAYVHAADGRERLRDARSGCLGRRPSNRKPEKKDRLRTTSSNLQRRCS